MTVRRIAAMRRAAPADDAKGTAELACEIPLIASIIWLHLASAGGWPSPSQVRPATSRSRSSKNAGYVLATHSAPAMLMPARLTPTTAIPMAMR